MTPHEFITKWRASELKERSASQEYFIDLCRLLDEPTPVEADPTGETYCFERGARKDTGGDGWADVWADVWKRHHFAWEYKGRRADLGAAFEQLRQYSLALENPPLLIVSDMVRFRIRTNWTNSVSQTHEFELDDLADAATRDRLKWTFSDPVRLRPGETRQSLTERASASFASVAQALRGRGHDPQTVAHFVNRLVFCMFADDVGLLPDHMFTRMLRHAQTAPDEFSELVGELFRVMAFGGRVGFDTVAWFNGGLFDDADALPLDRSDIETVRLRGRQQPRGARSRRVQQQEEEEKSGHENQNRRRADGGARRMRRQRGQPDRTEHERAATAGSHRRHGRDARRASGRGGDPQRGRTDMARADNRAGAPVRAVRRRRVQLLAVGRAANRQSAWRDLQPVHLRVVRVDAGDRHRARPGPIRGAR